MFYCLCALLILAHASLTIFISIFILFRDKSMLQFNKDQHTLLVEKGTTVMRPKSKASGIMVSDFIDERNNYLQLTGV